MKVKFYNAYIQSTFDYCCPIWGGSKKTQTIIKKSHKRIAGIILKKSSSNTLKDMHWLTFEKHVFITPVFILQIKSTSCSKIY